MAICNTVISLESEAPQYTTIFASPVGGPEEPYGDRCDQSRREIYRIHQSNLGEQRYIRVMKAYYAFGICVPHGASFRLHT